MATVTAPEPATLTDPGPPSRTPTIADILDHFDPILARRIVLRPVPGTATVEDVIAIRARERRLCELVDGTLVEKAMGFREAQMEAILIHLLGTFLDTHDLGIVLGADGMMRILPDQVRIPDVSFIAWGRFPDGKLPTAPVPAIIPDLAVEVLSESNTGAEMDRKLRDYFAAGVPLVWYMDPKGRTVRVYTAYDRMILVDESGTLDGGDVLPGFELRVADWFARAERVGMVR